MEPNLDAWRDTDDDYNDTAGAGDSCDGGGDDDAKDYCNVKSPDPCLLCGEPAIHYDTEGNVIKREIITTTTTTTPSELLGSGEDDDEDRSSGYSREGWWFFSCIFKCFGVGVQEEEGEAERDPHHRRLQETFGADDDDDAPPLPVCLSCEELVVALAEMYGKVEKLEKLLRRKASQAERKFVEEELYEKFDGDGGADDGGGRRRLYGTFREMIVGGKKSRVGGVPGPTRRETRRRNKPRKKTKEVVKFVDIIETRKCVESAYPDSSPSNSNTAATTAINEADAAGGCAVDADDAGVVTTNVICEIPEDDGGGEALTEKEKQETYLQDTDTDDEPDDGSADSLLEVVAISGSDSLKVGGVVVGEHDNNSPKRSPRRRSNRQVVTNYYAESSSSSSEEEDHDDAEYKLDAVGEDISSTESESAEDDVDELQTQVIRTSIPPDANDDDKKRRRRRDKQRRYNARMREKRKTMPTVPKRRGRPKVVPTPERALARKERSREYQRRYNQMLREKRQSTMPKKKLTKPAAPPDPERVLAQKERHRLAQRRYNQRIREKLQRQRPPPPPPPPPPYYNPITRNKSGQIIKNDKVCKFDPTTGNISYTRTNISLEFIKQSSSSDSSSSVYQCSNCSRLVKFSEDKQVIDRMALLAHARRFHGSANPGLCPVCGMPVVSTKGALYYEHRLTHLSEEERQEALDNPIRSGGTAVSSGIGVPRFPPLAKRRKITPESAPLHHDVNQCPTCGKFVANGDAGLRRHERSHHLSLEERKSHLCAACGSSFTTKSTLDLHIATLHPSWEGEVRLYKCPVCTLQNRVFTSEKNLEDHMRRNVHETNLQQGTVVGELTPGGQIRTGGDNKLPHQCPQCDKSFATATALKIHVTRYHVNAAANRGTYTCSMCLLKFRSKEERLEHYVEAHPRSKFAADARGQGPARATARCEYPSCKLQFPDKASLQSHVSQEHGGGRRPTTASSAQFMCSLCGKVVSKEWVLKQHHLIHSGERKHVCHVCSASFPIKSTLLSHLAAKHGQGPLSGTFTCQQPGCDKAYQSIIHYKSHLRGVHKIFTGPNWRNNSNNNNNYSGSQKDINEPS